MKQRSPLWSQMLRMCKSVFGPAWTNLVRAINRYGEVNGEQCAASFAYYAFFSLFPLVLLFVAIGTLFVPDREQTARRLVLQIESYTPLLQTDRDQLTSTFEGVLRHGWGAGILGVLVLVWSSLRFFQALVIGINRAWGGKDYDWWRLPLRNLLMIGILLSAGLLGVVVPLVLMKILDLIAWNQDWVTGIFTSLLPTLILFYCLLMFYRFAPRGRSTTFRHVWPAALFATLALKFCQHLFGIYLPQFISFNAVYGVFGSIMALLFWIYLSGVIVIFGGCISATAVVPKTDSVARKRATDG
ncbi:MAG TPA: YihY/virulence factor BrkB family protein [Chthoniobacterales bacterium]|nr:YihY/virulence factor BrkB family protein [Chthoniobacterales bacterium]